MTTIMTTAASYGGVFSSFRGRAGGPLLSVQPTDGEAEARMGAWPGTTQVRGVQTGFKSHWSDSGAATLSTLPSQTRLVCLWG